MLLLGRFGLLFGTLVAAGLALMAWAGGGPPSEELRVPGPRDESVRLILHRPEGEGPHPAVLCVHSVFQNDDTALPIARAMASNGYLAANLRLEGYSVAEHRWKAFGDYQEDVAAAVEGLRRQPEVDAERVCLLGHSMGADLACAVAASDPALRATVALGFPVEAGPEEVANLMLGVGAWDQLHGLGEMRQALRSATGAAEDRPERPFGSFADGTARQLVVSGLSDHALENFDPELYRRAVLWLDVACGLPARQPAVRVPFRVLGEGLATAGGAGLIAWVAMALLPGLRRAARGPFLESRALALACLVLVLALGLVNRAGQEPLLHRAMLALFVATVLLDGWARESGPEELPGRFRKGLLQLTLYGSLLAGVAALTMVVHAAEAVAWRPALVLGLPAALAMAGPVYLLKACSELYYLTPGTTGIQLATAGLLLLEFLAPGALFAGLALLPRRLVRAVRSIDLRLRFEGTPGSAAALVGALGGAAFAWNQVIQGGYSLGTDELGRLAWLFAKLALLPAVLLAGALRSRWFARAERRIGM